MTVSIITADVLEGLSQLEDESVHCVVTSPPYWGLRDYGTGTWEGGDAGCDHIEVHPQAREGRETPGGRGGSLPNSQRAFKSVCGKCGARRVDRQIGLEPTPDAFVARMVEVFREVRRVLRKDGTCWINLGDTYHNADKWGGGGANTGKHTRTPNGDVASWQAVRRKWSKVDGLKPKDLIGMPWRVAFALQADGWWLRSDVIWSKPNPMPESVTDRPTKAHEYLFLLTKSATYFYDADAIRERAEFVGPNSPASQASPYGQGYTRRATAMLAEARPPGTAPQTGMTKQWRKGIGAKGNANGFRGGSYVNGKPGPRTEIGNAPNETLSRNKRSVWTIATTPFPEAHFATFPPELPTLCIKAGCPAGGTVLDPFIGAGTTAVVADRLGRDAIGIELNPEYVAIAERRIARDRLERRAGTMEDVKSAKLEPTPLERLIEEGA